MKYSKLLREFFKGISLNVEDLLLLESFQIKYLHDRAPKKEFAALIRNYPFVKAFLEIKDPSIKDFIKNVLNANQEIADPTIIEKYCDELLWEIADLIVYNKHPEIYDEKAGFDWSIEEIIAKESLTGKVVIDVGAGSGFLAFMLSGFAETVFALEPISAFRSFIRQKAETENCTNLFTVDGFLDSLPFPDNSFDVLFTSNSIGWDIEKELQEIERVVKPKGLAIHLMRTAEAWSESPVHKSLTSNKWKYELDRIEDKNMQKLKYSKIMN